MFWPFKTKSATSELADTEWVKKLTDLGRKIAKVKGPMAADIARALSPGADIGEQSRHRIEVEVVVLALYLSEKDLGRRYGKGLPVMLTNMLTDRTAAAMTLGIIDDLAVEGLRSELRGTYQTRREHYKSFARVRAARGDSEHGTLVDGFGKLMTGTYGQRNAMARVIISTCAMELAKTMPAFLDEVGFAR